MARVAVLVTLAGACLAWAGDAASAGAASWGRPFRLAPPASLDVIGAQAAFSPTGAAALGFGVQDIDNPAASVAYAAGGSSVRRMGRPRPIQGAQQTLALGYAGSQLVLLVGSSPSGLACCGSVEAIRAAPGGKFADARRIVGGLAGATVARFVPLPGALLGAIATERGVWVSQIGADGRSSAARRLSGSKVLPQELDAALLTGNQSAVAWAGAGGRSTDLPGATTAPGARTIFVARGTSKAAPRSARSAFTVPAGHWISEFGLAGGRWVPTAAWVESWYDSLGLYHARAMVADLGQRVRPIAVSAPDELASGLSLAADSKGDEVLSWKGCTTAAACVARAVLRPGKGHLTAAVALGAADPSQATAAAVGPRGTALVAWIQQGHVLSATSARPGRTFGPAQLVSRTNYAADLALVFSPLDEALATWTQGTVAQSVIGAVYQAR